MLWPGTLIGAGAGYAIASIPGALLGGMLGQVLDRRLKLYSWAHIREKLGGRPAIRDEDLLFVLLGRLAKSGGRVEPSHIHQARAEMSSLRLGDSAQRQAIQAFNRGRDGDEGLRSYLRRLRGEPQSAEALLRACWRMAWADGKVGRVEQEMINAWGQWLGWSALRLQALADEHDPMKRKRVSPGDAYQQALALLGVADDSEPQAIKQAYRRLLSRHHPDKLEGSGANAWQVREATEKTGELHAAYVLIKARRGFR